jgi:hypothetical protein
MKFDMVEIGMFNLPGIVIQDDEENKVSATQLQELREWANEDPKARGKEINEHKRIWMFKNDKQRNYFIMRWG